jgi:hypothetical protein
MSGASGASLFGAILRRIDMTSRPRGARDQGGIHDRGFGCLQLQPVIFELAADLAQKIIVDAAFHERIAEAAMRGLVGHRSMQAQPTKQHEIEPHLERAFQLRVRQSVPLADQKALEQHQRIIAMRPTPRPPQTARQDGPERPPVDQRVDLEKHVVFINPNRRFTQEKVHHPTRKLPHQRIAGQKRRRNPSIMQRSLVTFETCAPMLHSTTSALGELARDRWKRATGEDIPPSPAVDDAWPAALELYMPKRPSRS